ncbi:predicted protein [Uncinocarpus reesii 1704]|uniref:Uncharacterized protein n=1 Tax=Uncinocarpus reesii (strain UAMH 1704) TaxID=336963 RepID=C4JKX5_UNCRE|nr:uncharacterized protein UREG_00208 [Uncinocarpus reesii 1704]EEP75362.1 predicted protein [Uncinocarpus reesii 1704]
MRSSSLEFPVDIESVPIYPPSENCDDEEKDALNRDSLGSREGRCPPAQSAKGFHPVRFDGSLDVQNKYKGAPDDKLDSNWRQLYDVDPFLVSKEALKKIQKTSVKVPSRPGYHLAKLAVFHQLHCLASIISPKQGKRGGV